MRIRLLVVVGIAAILFTVFMTMEARETTGAAGVPYYRVDGILNCQEGRIGYSLIYFADSSVYAEAWNADESHIASPKFRGYPPDTYERTTIPEKASCLLSEPDLLFLFGRHVR